MQRVAAFVLTLLTTSCIVIRGPRIDPHAEYDSTGRLAICTRGALKVESESGGGEFERWCDESWGVIEALALPEARGFVVAARKGAHAEGLLWRERTTDLWLVRAPDAAPERLTKNTAHEFDLALSSDGRSVIFRREEAAQGGGLMRAVVEWDWIALEPDAAPPELEALGAAHEFELASRRYAGSGAFGRDVEDPTSAWANPVAVSLDRAALRGFGPTELIDARPQGDSVLLYSISDYSASTWIEWTDLARQRSALLPVSEPVAARLSPDGGRAVIVERDEWVFDWLVLVVLTNESATAREYDRSGRRLREIDL
jgi:hypothetical protein